MCVASYCVPRDTAVAGSSTGFINMMVTLTRENNLRISKFVLIPILFIIDHEAEFLLIIFKSISLKYNLDSTLVCLYCCNISIIYLWLVCITDRTLFYDCISTNLSFFSVRDRPSSTSRWMTPAHLVELNHQPSIYILLEHLSRSFGWKGPCWAACVIIGSHSGLGIILMSTSPHTETKDVISGVCCDKMWNFHGFVWIKPIEMRHQLGADGRPFVTN